MNAPIVASSGQITGCPISMAASDYAPMFPHLERLAVDPAALHELAEEIARPAEIADNPNCPAGYTYFGQFIAHDLSHMRGEQNEQRAELDLATVYGAAAGGQSTASAGISPDLCFDLPAIGRREAASSLERDLPRQTGSEATIPDRRNDLHAIIGQLHLAFLAFHNRAMEDAQRAEPAANLEHCFHAARRRLRWHYQWLVVDDFLARLCDTSLMARLWPARSRMAQDARDLLPRIAGRLPLDFALAGFRFGHAMVRSKYRLNAALPERPIFADQPQVEWYDDWRGRRELVVRWSVQWNHFLAPSSPSLQYARRITPNIAGSLARLPEMAIDEPPRAVVNLAERTLLSGNGRLPSGQDAARYVAGIIYPRLGLEPFEVVAPERADPLWLYVLKEAERLAGGLRLGPLGSWICAATISALLIEDGTSFIHAESWEPDIPFSGDRFALIDLVRFAGLPTSRDEWDAYVDR